MSEGENRIDVQRLIKIASIIQDLPGNSPFHLGRQDFPAPALQAQTFDGVYEARYDLQNYRQLFPKLKTEIQPTPEEFEDFVNSIRASLTKQPVVFAQTMETYAIPPDTKRRVMWYRRGTSNRVLAEFLLETLDQEGLGPRDLVVVGSLRSLRSVPDIEHLHVLTRKPTRTQT